MNGNIYSTIIGTICSDPEYFYKVSGDSEPAGCHFKVAINRSFRENGEWRTATQFIEINVRGAYNAKSLVEGKWCKKGYHAYFSCEQGERQYTKRDGSVVKVPTFIYQNGHPILVSADYASQKRLNDKQEHQQANAEKHREAGAPVHQPVPVHDDSLADEGYPF